MITITAVGRLAAQPECRVIGQGTIVCEFRLLSTRYARGQEHTEAATFVCWNDVAEEFASTTVKGQEIQATGTQETQYYTPQGGEKTTYVKYNLTWFSRGRKPYAGDRQQSGQGGPAGFDRSQERLSAPQNSQRPQSSPDGYREDRAQDKNGYPSSVAQPAQRHEQPQSSGSQQSRHDRDGPPDDDGFI